VNFEVTIIFKKKQLLYMFFYKHMKFWNQAQLRLAVFDFVAHIMLSLFLTSQGAGLPLWEKLYFSGCEG